VSGMRTWMGSVLLSVGLMLSSRAALAACGGDCSGDGEVTINELVLGVNMALGTAPLSQCLAFDADGDGQVTINEVIGAVNSALNGCPVAAPTTTATATQTPAAQATATPTPGIVPPGISTQMLGTWSGHAKNDTTGVDRPARINIAVVNGSVVVKDLSGTAFDKSSSLTATPATPTALYVAKTVGSYPNGYIEALQLALAPDGLLAGTYSVTTISLPPKVTAVALILSKES